MVAKYGDWFSYERTPRARIFKRDHVKVTDIKSMTKLMRFEFGASFIIKKLLVGAILESKSHLFRYLHIQQLVLTTV